MKEYEGRTVTGVEYAVGGLSKRDGDRVQEVELGGQVKFDGWADVVKVTYRSDDADVGVIEVRHLNATAFRIAQIKHPEPKPKQEELVKT